MGQPDSESQPSAEIGKQNDGMMIIISNLELSYEQTIPIAEDYPQLVEKPMSNLPMPCKCAEGSNKCCIQNQNRFFPNVSILLNITLCSTKVTSHLFI